ncbi:MAG: hypothetical protein E6G79_13125 [Alphaproteobacteria bacterium]|nr:MAG: hypothetical protein E6G79_13125 [Alphaproteobacteria bacterium]
MFSTDVVEAVGTGLGFAVRAFALFAPVAGLFLATLGVSDLKLGLAGLVLFDDFAFVGLGALLAAEVLFADLVFFAGRLFAVPRLLAAEALAARAGRDLRLFFLLRLLAAFFLAIATTNSFYCSNNIVGE